jgi:3-oxoacyl-[acyl-carrier-protein] synthase-3
LTGLKIIGTGSYVPEHSVTNKMFESIVDTSDEWISSRTGIKTRCISDGETNFFMALSAAEMAIKSAKIKNSEIGVIICATITNEYITPSLSCLLQRELSLNEEVLTFDINAACSGFVYALNLAHSLLPAASGKYALIIGSELLSKIVDFNDRDTCVLFGDGAGAAVVKLARSVPFFFNAGAKGDSKVLYCPGVTWRKSPFSKNTPEQPPSFLHMDGSEVFRFAVDSIKKSISVILEKAKLKPEEIDHYVLHQANARIINMAAKRLGAPIEKFFMNIDKRGNTSAASIPIALDEMNRTGKLRKGHKVILSGFGGGLTYGSAYLTW